MHCSNFFSSIPKVNKRLLFLFIKNKMYLCGELITLIMTENYSGVYFIGNIRIERSRSEQDAADKYCEIVIGDRELIDVADVRDAFVAGLRMVVGGRKLSPAVTRQAKRIESDTRVFDEFVNSAGYSAIMELANDKTKRKLSMAVYSEYVDFCNEKYIVPSSACMFGRYMAKSGFYKKRTAEGVKYELYTKATQL